MNGSVLHFDGSKGQGIIIGEDGQRYSFATDDWKSLSSPQPGCRVDIVAEAGVAREIYVLPGAEAPAVEPKAAPAAPSDDWARLVRDKIAVAPAALIILASFLPFLAIPFLQPNLWSVPGYARMAASTLPMEVGGAKLLLLSTYLLWLIPGAAAWLIYRELRGEPTADTRVMTGVLGLGAPFALALLVQAAAPQILGGPSLSGMLSVMGSGWILVVLASAVLLFAGNRMDSWRETEPALAPPVRAGPEVASRTCPKCGTRYDGDRIFCAKDGTDLV